MDSKNNSDVTNENMGAAADDLGLGIKPIPRVLIFFRFFGMGLFLVAVIFLMNKSAPPLIIPFQNGPLGDIILTIGMIFFCLYFVAKTYLAWRSKKSKSY